MTVVLLSAGAASRLGKITSDKPKCLLPLKNGDTVLDVQLRNLIACDVENIVISAGYKVEMIERHLEKYKNSADIKVVYNPFYNISNNLISLWNVRSEVTSGDLTIINGDNLFEKSLIGALHACKSNACMLVNKKTHYDDDDMKVVITDGNIAEVNKDITHRQADAESIGMMRFQADEAGALLAKLDEMVRDMGNLSIYYLYAVQEIINNGRKVLAVDISGKSWQEIDYPDDYEEAMKRFAEFV